LLIVLSSAALIAVGDVATPRREVPKPTKRAAVPDRIGLAASRENDGLRLEWNREAATVRRATRGLLYIQDGTHRSQLPLTDRQLADSRVRYWPETGDVQFRLELFDGAGSAVDEVRVGSGRPSPFVRPRTETVKSRVSQPVKVIQVAREDPPIAPTLPPKESRWNRTIRRIPLLRRLKK